MLIKDLVFSPSVVGFFEQNRIMDTDQLNNFSSETEFLNRFSEKIGLSRTFLILDELHAQGFYFREDVRVVNGSPPVSRGSMSAKYAVFLKVESYRWMFRNKDGIYEFIGNFANA